LNKAGEGEVVADTAGEYSGDGYSSSGDEARVAELEVTVPGASVGLELAEPLVFSGVFLGVHIVDMMEAKIVQGFARGEYEIAAVERGGGNARNNGVAGSGKELG
jgi:hypothetical protein